MLKIDNLDFSCMSFRWSVDCVLLSIWQSKTCIITFLFLIFLKLFKTFLFFLNKILKKNWYVRIGKDKFKTFWYISHVKQEHWLTFRSIPENTKHPRWKQKKSKQLPPLLQTTVKPTINNIQHLRYNKRKQLWLSLNLFIANYKITTCQLRGLLYKLNM